MRITRKGIIFLVLVGMLAIPQPTIKQEQRQGGFISVTLENDREGHFQYYVAPIRDPQVINESKITIGDKTYYTLLVSVKTAIMVGTTYDVLRDVIVDVHTVRDNFGDIYIWERKESWGPPIIDMIPTIIQTPTGWGKTHVLKDSYFNITCYKVKIPQTEWGHPNITVHLNPAMLGFKEVLQAKNGSYNLENAYLSLTTAVIDNLTINETKPELKITYHVNLEKRNTDWIKTNGGKGEKAIADTYFYGIKKIEYFDSKIGSRFLLPNVGTQLNITNTQSINTSLGEFVTSAKLGLVFMLRPEVRFKQAVVEYDKTFGKVDIAWFHDIFKGWYVAKKDYRLRNAHYTLNDPNNALNSETRAIVKNYPVVGAVVNEYSIMWDIRINVLAIAEYRLNATTGIGPIPAPYPPIENGSDIWTGGGIGGEKGGEIITISEIFRTYSWLIILVILAIFGAILLIITIKVIVPLLQKKYELIMP